MKKILIITFLLITCLTFSQTTTTESKSCGSCNKEVSVYSKIGDTCPYCGVRWGYENTNNFYIPNNNSTSYPDYNSNNNNKSYSTNTKNTTTKETVVPNPFISLTKSEIIDWLILKLNKYQKSHTNCVESLYGSPFPECKTYQNFSFKIKDDILIVDYNFKDKNIDYIEYIPLYDIYMVYGKSYESDFSISTNKDVMIEINKTTDKEFEHSYFSIGFDNDGEENLIKKIEYAFQELAKKCTVKSMSDVKKLKNDINYDRPTEQETKNWLLSKIKSYSKNSYDMQITSGSAISVKNVNYTFKDMNLIISYEGTPMMTGVETGTITIPICDCYIRVDNKIKYYNNHAKLIISSAYKNIKNYSSYNGNNYYKLIGLSIDFDREENLFNRFDKAFTNLKYFCPKQSTSSEKF